AASKKGDWRSTSSCAAKSRPSRPTVRVTMGEGEGAAAGDFCWGVASRSLSDLCSFDILTWSRWEPDLFSLADLSTRFGSCDRTERLNMAAVCFRVLVIKE